MTYWRIFTVTGDGGAAVLAAPFIRRRQILRPDSDGWIWPACLWCWPIHARPGTGGCLGGLFVCRTLPGLAAVARAEGWAKRPAIAQVEVLTPITPDHDHPEADSLRCRGLRIVRLSLGDELAAVPGHWLADELAERYRCEVTAVGLAA
jgi:hypothetical protein